MNHLIKAWRKRAKDNTNYLKQNPTSPLAHEIYTAGALFSEYLLIVTKTNDGDEEDYQQPTPRARILAALKDIKSRETS